MNREGTGRGEREFFDAIAFAPARGHLTEDPRVRRSWDKHAKWIPHYLIKDKVVLDAGCGDGRFVRYCLDKGARFCIGLDISGKYILSGIRQGRTLVYTHYITCAPRETSLFIQADAQKMPVRSNCIETVLCLSAFHHLPNKRLFLEECRRVLTDGGHVIIVDPNGQNPLRPLANYFGRKLGRLSHMERAIKPKETEAYLSDAGFQIRRFIAMNLLSEINTHIAEILFYREKILLGQLFRVLIGPANRSDDLCEKSVFRIFPWLSWRYMLIAKKT